MPGTVFDFNKIINRILKIEFLISIFDVFKIIKLYFITAVCYHKNQINAKNYFNIRLTISFTSLFINILYIKCFWLKLSNLLM